MELKEFVTETLLSITEGVGEAIRRRLEDKSGVSVINPVWAGMEVDWKELVQQVEFDVAVTEADKTTGGGKAGIRVLPLVEVAGEGSKAWERSTVSRIKFSVPVILPAQRSGKSP
jgi:hypothetical protein